VLSARRLLRRNQRRAEARFLIEGPLAIIEALELGAELVDIFVSATSPEKARILAAAEAAGVPVFECTESVIKALSETTTPQGVVAVAAVPQMDLSDLPNDIRLALVLVAVRDPGNAGTLVRTAVGAGAGAVVFTEDSVDPFSPKTVRAAAGGLYRVPIISASLPEAVGALRERGVKLVGADADAVTSHDEADLSGPVAILLGNEAWGIPVEHEGLLDEVVGITMPGPAESLNVASAGAILLFEAVAQARRGRISSAIHE
jgi:TrmH family RNA methyltransferase